jgi:AraC-like DNA-binding protein
MAVGGGVLTHGKTLRNGARSFGVGTGGERNGQSEGKSCTNSTVDRLPYRHDWKQAYQTSLGLRVLWFGRDGGYPEWSVSTSRLAADMVCFFFVEQNRCWAVINGRRLELKPGDLLVVSGGDEFSYGHDPAAPNVSTSACLALERSGSANTLLQWKFDRRYSWSKPAEYSAHFDQVLNALRSRSPFRDLEIAGALLQWLAYVMSRLSPRLDKDSSHDSSSVDKILKAEAWVNSRLNRNVTLAEWARSVGLKPVYFGRLFKRETGLRPMEWLNQRRLQMASQYLSSTRKSVGEVAELCGFSDQFYFSRVFRRQFGQPPTRFRGSRG